MKTNLLAVFFLISFSSVAQSTTVPCSSPEASQFDFWIGTWDLYSADTITGTNTIYKIMDGCAVQENFEGAKNGYVGKSWSMFNPRTKNWQQTWVDNQGGYIALNGKFENNTMTLTTGVQKINGKDQINRMRFYNIKKDGFEWEWESSADNGSTWRSAWHIRYERKK